MTRERQMPGARSWLAAAMVLCVLAPRSAHADTGTSQMMSYSVIAAGFVEAGKAEYSGGKHSSTTTLGTGFRYYERQGVITGTLTAIAIVLAGAMAASSPKSTETWESGGWRYTRTTYRSEGEQAAIMAGAAAGAAGAASSKNQSFDLEIFSRNLGGDASGWRMNGYYGFPFAETWMFEFGMGFGSIDAAFHKDGQDTYISHGYIGMPFRFLYGGEHFLTFLEAQWNWLGHTDAAHADPLVIGNATLIRSAPVLPWKIGIASNAFGRLYGELSISTPGIISGEFAGKATLGLRF
jgi:hypothetical protein